VKAFAFWGGVSVRSKPAHARLSADRADQLPGPRLIDVIADGPSDIGDGLNAGNLPDGTVTVMFSDIEGFTSITERLGDRRAMEILREHNCIIRQRVSASAGTRSKPKVTAS
jgi:class 3 adenylate cyclase